MVRVYGRGGEVTKMSHVFFSKAHSESDILRVEHLVGPVVAFVARPAPDLPTRNSKSSAAEGYTVASGPLLFRELMVAAVTSDYSLPRGNAEFEAEERVEHRPVHLVVVLERPVVHIHGRWGLD